MTSLAFGRFGAVVKDLWEPGIPAHPRWLIGLTRRWLRSGCVYAADPNPLSPNSSLRCRLTPKRLPRKRILWVRLTRASVRRNTSCRSLDLRHRIGCGPWILADSPIRTQRGGHEIDHLDGEVVDLAKSRAFY